MLYKPSQSDAQEAAIGILAAGPWIRGECELPHRVVLRETDREYVIHNQYISPEGIHFSDGNYFPKYLEHNSPLKDAVSCFAARTCRSVKNE